MVERGGLALRARRENRCPERVHTTYWVYVLRSAKGDRLYAGVTSDLSGRIRAHNAGKTRSTRGRRPLRLVYSETYQTKQEALARERYFKTPEGGALKQRLVAAKENNPNGC